MAGNGLSTTSQGRTAAGDNGKGLVLPQVAKWRKSSVGANAAARVRHVIKSTKTNVARDVDITDRMMTVLQRQKAHSFMRGLELVVF